MNGIILYKSKYGATKKYAEWLSNETDFSVLEIKNANPNELLKFDTIIFAGGIYASGIAGISFLKKNYELLKQKQIIVFCVGASPYDKDVFRALVTRNMKNDLKDIPIFYGRGSWNIENMTFTDKTLCKMLKKAVSKKSESELEPWEKALVQAGENNCDWSDKSYLTPIIDILKRG